MDKDGKFWVSVWAIVGLTLTSVVAIGCLSAVHTKDTMLDMVKAGGDVLESSCAMYDTLGDSPVCVALASQKVREVK